MTTLDWAVISIIRYLPPHSESKPRNRQCLPLIKADIIDDVQNQLGYDKNESSEIVEILLEIIKGSLENGEDVLISGFGKFQVKNKKEHRGRNPATGKDLILSPRKVVTFKCSGRLRDHINK